MQFLAYGIMYKSALELSAVNTLTLLSVFCVLVNLMAIHDLEFSAVAVVITLEELPS